MATMRIIGLAAAGLYLGLAAASPASADGLARFEKLSKGQIPPGVLVYKSSKGLGDDGFRLDDVVITPPESDKDKKPQPINVKTITVERFDFDSVEKQQPPLYAKIKFDGVTAGSEAAGFDLKQMANIDNVSADFGIDYRLDGDKKTFTLKRLELNLNGLGKLESSFVIDGLSADAATKPDQAMNDAFLKTGDLTYDDHSLLSKAVPVAAAMQGSDPKALVAMAVAMLDGMRENQSEAAQQVIDTLVAYVEDYAKPKGPLKITLNPPDKVSSAQLSDAKTADEMVKLLGIKVSYAGTRSSKPGAAAAAAKDVPAKDEDNDDDKKTLSKKK
ncbi:MAG TPA: hypothetical protein VFQ90_06495 [Stellaceae bacterium]|nr:hypothetical protein [Stellaceae bacterium]